MPRKTVGRGWRWGVACAILTGASALAGLLATAARTHAHETDAHELTFSNPSGTHGTRSLTGPIDVSNPFFQDLGTNGRTCFTCHRPAQAWSVTPQELRERFAATDGLDPIFRNNDGSACEGADLSSIDRRRDAFGPLLTKGLIRVGLPVPAHAEFEIVDVDDPYHCGRPFDEASMYRRVLPSTNLAFLSTVMWDGRETVAGQAIALDLRTQAINATIGHAQGDAPSVDQAQQIVDFELGLFTAQTHDRHAGTLSARGAFGGPGQLSRQPFCIGINDPLGMLPAMPGACAPSDDSFDPIVFRLFGGWEDATSRARRAIASGERVFNTRTFVIDNVGGLNGAPGDPVAGPIQNATCTVCHDTPGVGNHSVSLALNLGLTDASRRTPDLPLYTLENRATHETVQTTDPGRAMITGKWGDIGKFKGPILRALAARAPYFHNGGAATLEDVVRFYDERFHINLTAPETRDLVAFLEAL